MRTWSGSTEPLRELSLFTGAGGGLLALSGLLGFRTVAAVEINPFCRRVLRARQADGILDAFPIFEDVREFDGRPWRGSVDVVSSGFPCVPYSTAGAKRGAADPRDGWPDTLRIIREVDPRFVFLENVSNLLRIRDGDGRAVFGRILGGLADSGLDCRWTSLSSADLGAPHRRRRLWLLAYADGERRRLRRRAGSGDE